MAPSTTEIFQAALSLPDEERQELIKALIAAADVDEAAPIDAAWRATIQRRSVELDSGAVNAVPWQEIQGRVHKKLGFDE